MVFAYLNRGMAETGSTWSSLEQELYGDHLSRHGQCRWWGIVLQFWAAVAQVPSRQQSAEITRSFVPRGTTAQNHDCRTDLLWSGGSYGGWWRAPCVVSKVRGPDDRHYFRLANVLLHVSAGSPSAGITREFGGPAPLLLSYAGKLRSILRARLNHGRSRRRR